MSDKSGGLGSYLRGLARGVGPDLLGGPVDLSKEVVNAGILGTNMLGKATGLTQGEIPQIKEAFGDSDWFARLANVPDDGSLQYTAGRLTPLGVSAAGAGLQGTKRLVNALLSGPAPRSPKSQVGAIRMGGNPSLFPSHDTTLENLANAQGTRGGTIELMSPSFAITKDSIPTTFSGGSIGSVQLIPRIGAFDPATSTTSLFNRDAYTPRWGQFASQPIGKVAEPSRRILGDRYKGNLTNIVKAYRQGEFKFEDLQHTYDGGAPGQNIKEALEALKGKSLKELEKLELDMLEVKVGKSAKPPQGDKQHMWTLLLNSSVLESKVPMNLRAEAAKRLVDRLYSPAQGRAMVGQEGGKLMAPGTVLSKNKITNDLSHDLAIAGSPSFRSFEQFEKSPLGAKLLTAEASPPEHYLHEKRILHKALKDHMLSPDIMFKQDFDEASFMRDLLQFKLDGMSPGQVHAAAVQRLKDSGDVAYNTIQHFQDNPQGLIRVLQDLRKGYRSAPSNYAELKALGPVAVNSENFAGAILRPGTFSAKEERALARLKSSGLSVRPHEPWFTSNTADIADFLQTQAGPARKTKIFER